jgi:hypothetical protein
MSCNPLVLNSASAETRNRAWRSEDRSESSIHPGAEGGGHVGKTRWNATSGRIGKTNAALPPIARIFWGAQAASLQHPAACRTERLVADFSKPVCGRLPQTTGWQPALPSSSNQPSVSAFSSASYHPAPAAIGFSMELHQLQKPDRL